MDVPAGRKFFGNPAGFKNNVIGSLKICHKVDSDIKAKNPVLYHLKTKRFAMLDSKYDPSLIERIKSKYDQLIENDTHSIATSGYGDDIYCRQLRFPSKDLLEMADLITDQVIKIVKGYFNSNFIVKEFSSGRNYHVPPEINSEEMFSNHWHCDRREISELKFLVYLSNVTEQDGPFHVQSAERTRELMRKGFGTRGDYRLPLEVLEHPDYVKKITGHIGTAFFSNNNVCLHRAGNPALGHTRDTVSFVFVPSKKPLPVNWLDDVIPLQPEEYRRGNS